MSGGGFELKRGFLNKGYSDKPQNVREERGFPKADEFHGKKKNIDNNNNNVVDIEKSDQPMPFKPDGIVSVPSVTASPIYKKFSVDSIAGPFIANAEYMRDNPPDFSTFDGFMKFVTSEPIDVVAKAISEPVKVNILEDPRKVIKGQKPNILYKQMRSKLLKDLGGDLALYKPRFADYEYILSNNTSVKTITLINSKFNAVQHERIVTRNVDVDVASHTDVSEFESHCFDSIYFGFAVVEDYPTRDLLDKFIGFIGKTLKPLGRGAFGFLTNNDDQCRYCDNKLIVRNQFSGFFSQAITRLPDGKSYFDFVIPVELLVLLSQAYGMSCRPLTTDEFNLEYDSRNVATLMRFQKTPDFIQKGLRAPHLPSATNFMFQRWKITNDDIINEGIDMAHVNTSENYANGRLLTFEDLTGMNSNYLYVATKHDGLNMLLFSGKSGCIIGCTRDGRFYKMHQQTGRHLTIKRMRYYNCELLNYAFTFNDDSDIHCLSGVGMILFDCLDLSGGVLTRLAKVKREFSDDNNILDFCCLQTFTHIQRTVLHENDEIVVCDVSQPKFLYDPLTKHEKLSVRYYKQYPTIDVFAKNAFTILSADNQRLLSLALANLTIRENTVIELAHDGRFIRPRYDKTTETDRSVNLMHPPADYGALKVIQRAGGFYRTAWDKAQVKFDSPEFQLKDIYQGTDELNLYSFCRDSASMQRLVGTYPWPIVSSVLSTCDLLHLYQLRHSKLHMLPDNFVMLRAIVEATKEMCLSMDNFKSKRRKDEEKQIV